MRGEIVRFRNRGSVFHPIWPHAEEAFKLTLRLLVPLCGLSLVSMAVLPADKLAIPAA